MLLGKRKSSSGRDELEYVEERDGNAMTASDDLSRHYVPGGWCFNHARAGLWGIATPLGRIHC